MRRENEMSNEDAVAGPSNVESPPELFKLDIDCFDEVFEYLSLKDLYFFGQTCKRMNRVAGEYFKLNFSSAIKFFREDPIQTITSTCRGTSRRFPTSGFVKFMPCISIYHFIDKSGKYLESRINECESTKQIRFEHPHYKNLKLKYFEKLLPQLEILHFRGCSRVDNDFYDKILHYVENLREIYFERSELPKKSKLKWLLHGKLKWLLHGKLKWLLQEYPKLEVLHLTPRQFCRIEELRQFFDCNPNLNKFSTHEAFLWDNRDIFLNSNAKLDVLELTNWSYEGAKKPTPDFLLELLNQLHDQGFYKRLYYYCFNRPITRYDLQNVQFREQVQFQFDLVTGLELLCIYYFHPMYNLVQLTNLRELYLVYGGSVMDMEILANGLTKLNRLLIYGQNVDVLMPFIRRSLNLSKINFESPRKCDLNLRMLNAERSNLIGAQKITIYVNDVVFLATKWTTRNGDTNLRSIEMRRSDSIEWIPYY